jgi:hypothetical protein
MRPCPPVVPRVVLAEAEHAEVGGEVVQGEIVPD